MPSIEELKKFIKTHEVKIDDAEQEVANEPNKKKKKDLENALKKLQNDEKYVKAKEEVKAAEAQAQKEAERAALSGKAADKKADAKGKKKEETKAAPKADAKVDEATFKEIDEAFAASGKDAADRKATAVSTLEMLAAATPFVLPRLPQLIPLFDNSKLAAPALKAATAIVEQIAPAGHSVADRVMPPLLAGIEDKKWKVKAGCIQVLLPALKQMEGSTSLQLANCLPTIVSKLAEAALEVRAEIRSATGAVLKEIGAFVGSPEIKALSPDLVQALAEPTNQKHTQGVLAKMGNATFKSMIDEASLALLLPIVMRGLKDREAMSKKWSAQIFGSAALLVRDVDFLKPYLKTALPLLQAALNDSVPEVRREAAKAYGILEQVMPEYSRTHCQPFLFGKLRAGDASEQIGAAMGLAEVFVRMEKAKLTQLMPEVQKGANEESVTVRRGFLELMDTMPQAMKMDFVPYIERLFPAMLMGINGEKDLSDDPAMKAAQALVGRFGDLCPDLLMAAFEGSYAKALGSSGDWKKMQIVREKSMQLLLKTAEKILEHKKFGQDLLTCDECSNKATRLRVLILSFVARSDPDAAVKRVASNVWKTSGGSPKMQKTIIKELSESILKWRAGSMGAGLQKVAKDALAELVKAGDLEEPSEDAEAVTGDFAFEVAQSNSAEAARIAAGQGSDSPADEADIKEDCQMVKKVENFWNKQALFGSLPGDLKSHALSVSESVIREGHKKKLPGPKVVEELQLALQMICQCCKEQVEEFCKSLPDNVEALCREVLGEDFEGQHHEGYDAGTLLRVENMLLMYGAGKLLLKDTMLEMKANRRYGVVGHNGAGKTTLMKEIVAGRIVGMPTHLRCVHVDDSKLGEMSKSSLNALEYVQKKAMEIGVTDASAENLRTVGFPEKMFEVPVAELSTGWRMRLTLAVSMLKHADIVLLDEPTNHLDQESVDWLGDYLLQLTRSSVMVISHEPKFLNKICTDIISYKDRQLVYTEGNFDAFVMAKGIKADDIEALLSGNLKLDEEEGEEGAEEAAKAAVQAPITGPPKISFPIPGSVEGVKSSSKAVIEFKNLSFRYGKDKDYLITDVAGKLSLGSRVAICGRNGCGKSTLMTLICSEMNPSENKDGKLGEVTRHCNLRVAYMKQDHLKTLGPYFDTSPLNYITQRFKNGYDEELQRRLIEPEDDEEAARRATLAKQYGKYGNQVGDLLSRSKQGSQLYYEVRWEGLDDPKQNTMVSLKTLRDMGLDKVVIACDERIAAKAAGLDQRPLTRREITKHCEAFGIDEEMCCNQQIRGFSAGQKVRLSLAAMFWTKPHFIAVDEPTNYLDVETVEALAKALNNFRGGILMIEPKMDFVEKVCNETWTMEDGKITVQKLDNGLKRVA
ncbi:Elongation factor 3B (EF-3B) (Homolog of EF-3) (Translation elongation factor 3B) [Durusdinium trenchii]|uniref:Elongation factor 3 n=1 Tax=Durusdinium trenchii TaxID=1381693 RepID=A0ABP0JZB9_9DINO